MLDFHARISLLAAAAGAFFAGTVPASVTAQRVDPAVDTSAYAQLAWRNIGPTRGGRSVAAAGVASNPMVYYFGGVGGGVWKTTDAGITWENVTDGQLRTSSVGAIAVAPSDPNVVYVGMGEHAVRGVTTSHGDGVYRSTDAGKTWTHVGLPNSRAISRIRIHPTDPDLVYVAVQGAPYGPSEDRGVYRSPDGGATWEKVLGVNETTGASDLSLDVHNPRILYAATWDHLREPWTVRSGGEGSGIYKSTDAGSTWTKLTKGLPATLGKTAVDVSAANPERVYAMVEANEGGLYRSDDGGASWRLMNDDRVLRARAWYYIEVYADPQDEETVYVLNAPMMKSIDGGRTFENVRTPHGDNHDLWINPTDHEVMINANDGGANVSMNGGRSWSTQQNQPTAQFYRVNTDNRFFYHLYAGQQDNSTVAIASRTDDGGIDWKDWYPVSGCESAHVAFNPDNPRYVYAGCYQGQIGEYDHETGTTRDVMAYPFLGLAMDPKDMRYRFNWNAPIVVSMHDRSVIYHAGNMLLSSRDRGFSWQEVSPDLTRDEEDKQGPGGGPITSEGAGGEIYNTILAVAESHFDAGTIWVGTDDGLVQVTRDGGATWTNVTPGDIGRAMINSIDASPHDPATAYLAVTNYKFDDFTPHIFKTDDYGENWTRIVRGIEREAWVRVVREDPARAGLLYAGTETGMYVSFDDGDHWQSLQLNLPVTPVTDLKVHDDDLVASTQGRAFWILDDIGPLRSLMPNVMDAPLTAFDPAPVYRVGGGGGFGGFGGADRVGRNPPSGAVIDFVLAEQPDSLLTVEILDDAGTVIRTLSSKPEEGSGMTRVSVQAGHNRVVWDLRHESVVEVPDLFVYGSLQGRQVIPAAYTVRITTGEHTAEARVEVRGDPRIPLDEIDYRAKEELLVALRDQLYEIHDGVNRVRSVRGQVETLLERADEVDAPDTIAAAGEALTEALTGIEEDLVQPDQETFQDVINFKNRLNAQIIDLRQRVDGSEAPLTAGMRTRSDELSAEWARLRTTLERVLGEDLDAFNRLVEENGIPAIIAPKRERTAS